MQGEAGLWQREARGGGGHHGEFHSSSPGRAGWRKLGGGVVYSEFLPREVWFRRMNGVLRLIIFNFKDERHFL